MRMVTFSKRKIKRIAAVASMAVAAVAVGAVAVITSVGTQAAGKLLPIYSVERGDNKIALTFDVAWENSNTDELIDILEEFDAQATFFVTGDWCDRYPEDVLKFYDAGHEVQNHSDQHPHVEGMNVNELISDTKECSRKIEMITGEKPTLYRAPYGEYDDSLITTVEGMGMKVIQWDVDSVDWKEPSPDEIVEKVLAKTASGSILLFHNDLENTTQALPEILTMLRDKGYEFVTVNDLIYHEDYSINADGKQIPDKKASVEITPDNVDEVLARYSDKLSELGFSEEQISQAAEAIKDGKYISEEILMVISDFSRDDSPDTVSDMNSGGGNANDRIETPDKTEPQNDVVTSISEKTEQRK